MSNAMLMMALLCVALGLGWLWERECRIKAGKRHQARMARLTIERNDAVMERELLEARLRSLRSRQDELLRQKQDEYFARIAKMERENRTNNVIAAQVFEKAKRRKA